MTDLLLPQAWAVCWKILVEGGETEDDVAVLVLWAEGEGHEWLSQETWTLLAVILLGHELLDGLAKWSLWGDLLLLLALLLGREWGWVWAGDALHRDGNRSD